MHLGMMDAALLASGSLETGGRPALNQHPRQTNRDRPRSPETAATVLDGPRNSPGLEDEAASTRKSLAAIPS